MPSDSVVIGLDVFEYIGLGLFPGPIAAIVNLLDLERVKEALHGGVVVAIALPAHAAQETIGFQKCLIVLGGVLEL